MAEVPFPGEIEVVRGSLDSRRAAAVVRFLAEHGGVEEADAREELDRVVCLSLAPGGELEGLSSVESATVQPVGGVRLWLHRSVMAPGALEAEDPMIAAGLDLLEDAFEPDGGGPIGVCQVIGDRDRMRREAVCPRTGLLHAGFLEDGSQLRVRYFDQASIGPRATPLAPVEERRRPPPLDQRYRIEPIEQGSAGPDDVLALWAREGAVPAGDAERRVHEVDLVAVDQADGVVGVCSSYLQRNNRLRMDMRYFRAFVAAEHRRSSLAFVLALKGREHLEGMRASGADARADGILYEVESELLKRYRNEANWAATDFTYIGETDQGAHVRVHYFPGARVPLPD